MFLHSHKKPLKSLLSGLFGILLFLVILVAFRFIAHHTSWPLFDGFVDLLYAHAALIIFFSILFTIGEIFAGFSFPFNLPFPIFNAVASVLLVSFLISVLQYIDTYYAIGTGKGLDFLKVLLMPVTLVIVLIAGYISIFTRLNRQAPPLASPQAHPLGSKEGCPSWETIGDEFRQMVADLIRKIREEINRE